MGHIRAREGKYWIREAFFVGMALRSKQRAQEFLDRKLIEALVGCALLAVIWAAS
jgi:hypothetical protein